MPKQLPALTVVRAYDVGERDCGYRVLVDRLWPRGLTKQELHIDLWAKDVAPSAELRKWFGHESARWSEFKQRYQQELRANADAVDKLVTLTTRRRVALLFGARDVEHNHAEVLRAFLQRKRTAARSKR